MTTTVSPDTRDRWVRSELALAAGRSALLGFMIYEALENFVGRSGDFNGGYHLDGFGDALAMWLPLLAMYFAGSPRVLAWLSEKAGTKVRAFAGGAWLLENRLYLRFLSARALSSLLVVVLV